MKILHLNFNDLSGGAARAAYRLHQGLRNIGVDSQMLVQFKESDDPTVTSARGRTTSKKISQYLESLPLKIIKKHGAVFWNGAWVPSTLPAQVERFRPDIIHLHWICGGLLSVAALKKLQIPMVWTLHDYWAFTGGCHIVYDCLRYWENCGCCPQLASSRPRDLSRWVWRRKARHWQEVDFTVVAPSRWLADCARGSSLFRHRKVEVIPHGLDLNRFKPLDAGTARTILGLPTDQKIVLSGTLGFFQDRHKGALHLQEALRLLAARGWAEKARLAIVGSSRPSEPLDVGWSTEYFGILRDDISLAILYNAVDLMVLPSLQEAFSLMALEPLACGTPVVAFHIGGLPDIIEHGKTGYLARPFEVADLASGIEWVLSDDHRHESLRQASRERAIKKFDLTEIAQQYFSLYKEIFTSRH